MNKKEQVVVGINKSSQKFIELMDKTLGIFRHTRYKSKDKIKFPFLMIYTLGIESFKKLEIEYQKVESKTSNYSSNQRNAIKITYERCTNE